MTTEQTEWPEATTEALDEQAEWPGMTTEAADEATDEQAAEWPEGAAEAADEQAEWPSEGPMVTEAVDEAADDEAPWAEVVAEAADEQAKTEATNGAHDAGSATWPSWPKVPIMNVTQDYPSQMDKDRLDIFWSKYKTKQELVQSDMYMYICS